MRLRRPVTLLILAGALLVSGNAAGQTPGGPVRVSIWTARPPIVDLDQKDREDAVKNICDRLDKKVLVLSPREESEIQVEVTGRALQATGAMESRPGVFTPKASPVKVPTIFATLRFGDYTTDLVCAFEAEIMTWRAAGAVCAQQIRKWVTANLGQIRPKREGPPS